MADEHVFLNDGGLYVSNTRIVLTGTTYATANITSVAKRFTPASKGCAVTLVVFGILGCFGVLANFDGFESLVALVLGALIVAAGVAWLKSLKPTYHIVLASASGEVQGLSSKDGDLIDQVIGAITSAITYRG